MAEIGSVIDGKYEVLREIGRGGMSIVYLAMDTRLNKQWAIKEIWKKGNGKKDEIIVNSLLAEANLMKRLDHPALPRIVDIIDNGETIYVIMDYIEGESLDKILNEYGSQPEELVIGWAKQLCDALSYLHSQKPPIIYRDMKPANIMLKPEGNIKIIDFGIAREYKEQKLSDTTVLGTKGYAPPEQYSGQTDARSDIFALGMTMHHLLTGIDPRSGEAYAPVRMWNPELSEGIEIIIDKCVEPAAENRYQNCADLLYDLEHPELITKDYKKRQKRKVRLFAASFIMAVLMLVSGFVCKIVSNNINNSNYDYLISILETSPLTEKIESYNNAIKIYPYRTDAYLKFLEAYEVEGKFDTKESTDFMGVYKIGQKGFDTTSESEAELNYKAGTMYFNYYTENGKVSISSRVQKAYPFFELNYTNENISKDFEKKNLSDCYYQICSFYKNYILNSARVEDASKSNYDDLFVIIDNTLEDVESASVYDKLSLYNAVFMLLYDQRNDMMQVDIEKDFILSKIDTVYNKAKAIKKPTKEQSKKLRQEILDNYALYKDAIERTYNNAERGQ